MIGNHLEPFKFWCQKVLPNVYDDSLSYYEYLCKLNEYLNEVIEQINTLTDNMSDYEEDLTVQWGEYKSGLNTEWNDYKTQLTEQWTYYKNYIDHYFDNLDVQTEINNKLDQMALNGTLSALIEPFVGTDIQNTVNAWLTEHVDPVGSAVIVDNTLSITGAAADAKKTGDEIGDIITSLTPVTVAIESANAVISDDTPINLIKRPYLVPNQYVGTNGKIGTSSSFYRTNYIEISPSTYYIGGNTGLSCFYDENFDFISYIANFTTAIQTPNNAKYVIISIPTNAISVCWLVQGTSAPPSADDGVIKDRSVRYTTQSLTDVEKAQARTNIGATDNALFNQLTTEYNKTKEIVNYETIRTNIEATNLVNYDSIIENYYVGTDGNLNYSTDWTVTPFIPIEASVSLSSTNCGLTCFYNSNKEFISYVTSPNGNTTPSNTAYMRIDIPKTAYTGNVICSKLGYVPPYNDKGVITLSKNKQIETSDWVIFTVPVNQAIVNTDDTTNQRDDNENIVNVECVYKLPGTYTPYGKPTKLVMICHGAGRGVTTPNAGDNKSWIQLSDYNAIANKFLNAGYAVFDCNGYSNEYAGNNFWGCHRGVEAWRKAYDYMVNNFNVETDFSIYGFSMGGLTALNLVMEDFPNVKCVALGSPVLNLEACWNEGGDTRTKMQLAYGMTTSYDADKARGCDPIKRLITIGSDEYCLTNMPPIKIWYGSTEVGANNSPVNKAYAIQLVNAIVKSGNFAIYREVEGAGHEICYGANANMNTEYLFWINRFNG